MLLPSHRPHAEAPFVTARSWLFVPGDAERKLASEPIVSCGQEPGVNNRAGMILDSLASTRIGVTMSELARITDPPKSSLVGLLAGPLARAAEQIQQPVRIAESA